ncbi:MAG: hypothetical protein WC379_06835 [Methanoregula sp.]|jgi:PKD repeat protein
MNLQRYNLVLAGLLIITLAFMMAPVTAAMVTITTSPPMGDAYYLGDTITYSGINTESDTTYLFIRGPNLPLNGGQIQVLDPRHFPVREDNESTFLAVDVGPDNQWSWAWDTHYYSLDPGTYTVYAASAPRDLTHINDTVYNKTTFDLRKPVPTVTIQPTYPVQGDTITISGIAKGSPGPGIAIWIIGPEYSDRFVINPDPDGFYSLDINSAEKGMAEGSYHVVVHHPGHWNDLFDIYLDGDWVYDNNTKSNKFRFLGPGRLQGVDAYEALTDAIWYNLDDLIPRDDYDEPLPITFHLQPEVQSAPVVSFTGSPTTGDMPIEVTFIDSSTGGQNGWAWFFGDEDYSQPWTLVTGSAGWAARQGFSSVVLPDGSIILMGGQNNYGNKNDVWQSKDNGAVWTLVNNSPGWSSRVGHSSVAMPDGSILLMGGVETGGALNDTWRSTDKGVTWSLVNASSGWPARAWFSTVVMQDGSIVLMGGVNTTTVAFNEDYHDVWSSEDNGTTWTLVNPVAAWSPRIEHSSIVLPGGDIVLTGGFTGGMTGYMNDTWRSPDKGVTWTEANSSSGWHGRTGHSTNVMPDGSIILMGGGHGGSDASYLNDTWRSNDNGTTWTQMTESSGWPVRNTHSSVMMPDGSILLMGGDGSILYDGIYHNDVWRFQPAGSSEQDPVHTYATPGTYPVALQVYNSKGYNSTLKNGYITVGALNTAFNVITIAVDPSGDMRSGVPLNVTYTVHLSGTGEETFRSNSYLVMSTDLDNARWNYTMILDGVETPQPGSGGQALYLSGWILSYPSTIDEALRVTLEGNAPSVSSPARQMIVNVTEIASHSRPILSTRFSRDALVSPAGTLPVIPLSGCSQPPIDPDDDGLYEDLNGDGLITFADVQLYFYQLDWMRINEPVAAFDFNGNGNLEFNDIVHLNHEVVP